MRGARSWAKIALVAGVAAAVAFMVSPALGGSSLKKLVKKEVAKQISKAKGPAGINGAANVTYRRTTLTNVSSGSSAFRNASCQPGEKLIGGGTGFVQQGGSQNYNATDRVSADAPGVATSASTATPVAEGAQPDVWHGSGTNMTGGNEDFVVYAVCANP